MSREYSENVLVQNSAGNLLQKCSGLGGRAGLQLRKAGARRDVGPHQLWGSVADPVFSAGAFAAEPVAHPEPAGRGAEEIYGARFHRIPDADQ